MTVPHIIRAGAIEEEAAPKPADGVAYYLDEVCSLIGAKALRALSVPGNRNIVALVDRDALLERKPRNHFATLLAHREVHGDVLVCYNDQVPYDLTPKRVANPISEDRIDMTKPWLVPPGQYNVVRHADGKTYVEIEVKFPPPELRGDH